MPVSLADQIGIEGFQGAQHQLRGAPNTGRDKNSLAFEDLRFAVLRGSDREAAAPGVLLNLAYQ